MPLCSDLRSRTDRQGQNWHVWPVRDGAGGQVEEEDEDRAEGTEPGVEREVLLVSTFNYNPRKLLLTSS